jgi:hypothetical protein
MIINLRVSYADGTTADLDAKAIDIVAFEERFDLSMASLKDNIQIRHLLFMAWHVAKRTGQTKDTFEKWLETVESVEAPEPKK